MTDSKETLRKLLSTPTAPYREGAIKNFVTEFLSFHGVPHFLDPIGNVIVGAESKKDYLTQLKNPRAEPLRVFIAHMDHPGFHGIKWKDEHTLEVEWFGGSPVEKLEGATVRLHAHVTAKNPLDVFEAEGILQAIELAPHGRAIKKAEVRLTQIIGSATSESEPRFLKPKKLPPAEAIFGAFSFRAPYWKENEMIYSKACDDLIGVYAILELARKSYARSMSRSKSRTKKSGRKPRPPFLAMLTRAEEVGFIGAIGHFELGWLDSGKRPRFVVSLETSRTLPQAEIGKGPILRLGDRMSVFDSGLTHWLVKLGEKILPGETQKRIMDGGSCEGSAALAYGFRTIALSVPLGNYHNQSLEGGPDARYPNGPGPEFVAEKDVERLQKLVEAIVAEKVLFDQVYLAVRKNFKNSFKAAKLLLKTGQKE
jgi:putative aminopeptidase FrvX